MKWSLDDKWNQSDVVAECERLQGEKSRLEDSLRTAGKQIPAFTPPADPRDDIGLHDALESHCARLRVADRLPRSATPPVVTPPVEPPAPRLTSFTPDRYGPALIDSTLRTAKARVEALEAVIVRAGGTPPRFYDNGASLVGCKDIRARMLEAHAEDLEKFCAQHGVSLDALLASHKEKSSMTKTNFTGATAKVMQMQGAALEAPPKVNGKGEKLTATERALLAKEQRDEAKAANKKLPV